MAATKSIIFTVLFALSVVLAQDSSSTPSSSGFMGIPGLPNIPGFQIPGLPNFSNGFPTIPGLPNFPGFGGSRTRRQTEESSTPVTHENGDRLSHEERLLHEHENQLSHEREDRLFFTLFPTVTGCNFTATPGVSCVSCSQALTCLPSNVGLSRTCRGLFPYCNNGRCSLFRGAACFATTSTSTSTTSTTTTTTTTAATGK